MLHAGNPRRKNGSGRTITAMLNWWSNQGQLLMRASAGIAVALGLFIVYVVTTRRRAAA
jgi:hypothetical protein